MFPLEVRPAAPTRRRNFAQALLGDLELDEAGLLVTPPLGDPVPIPSDVIDFLHEVRIQGREGFGPSREATALDARFQVVDGISDARGKLLGQ